MKKEEVGSKTSTSRKPLLIGILLVAAVFLILGVLIGKNAQGKTPIGECVGTGQIANHVTQLPPGTYFLPDGNEIWVFSGLIYKDSGAKKSSNKGYDCNIPEDIMLMLTSLENTSITDVKGNEYRAYLVWYGSDIVDLSDEEVPVQVEEENPQ